MPEYTIGQIVTGSGGKQYRATAGGWELVSGNAMGAAPSPAQGDGYSLAGEFKPIGDGFYKNRAGTMFRQGPKGGFQEVGGPTRSTTDDRFKRVEGVNKGLSAVYRTLDQFTKAQTLGPQAYLTDPTNLMVLQQNVRDLQLRLKEEPYNLGALTGPDMAFIESISSDPASLKAAIFQPAFKERMINIARILGGDYGGAVKTFKAQGGDPNYLPSMAVPAGYKPKPQRPQPSASGGTSTGQRPSLDSIFGGR